MSMRYSFALWIGLSAVVIAMACGRDAAVTGEGQGAVVSGIGASADANGWRIEEVMRLGTLDGEGPTVFGRIGAIEVDADRNLIVFDGLARELRMFTREGVHLMSFGRAGSGPGEFQNVLGLALAPNGNVWIVDSRNARYTVVGRDGSFHSFPRGSRIFLQPWTAGFGGDGFFYDYAVEPHAGGVDHLMLQVNTAGEAINKFGIPSIDVPQPDFGGGVSVALPFAPQALGAWDRRGRVWQAVSSEYRIVNVTLNRDTILVVSRAGEPRELTTAQRDSLASAIQRVERLLLGQTIEPSLRATTVPPLRWFSPDDEDRLWVCATGADPCSELDVFDAAGTFLGTVDLPRPVLDLPRPFVRDGHLYAAVEAELGVPQVFVGRIVDGRTP